jgi:hypothetical protein
MGIIKFLIGQFDLITRQIKDYHVWELIWVELKDLIKCKYVIILWMS